MKDLPEQELVRAARGGDADAFEALVRRYEKPVYALTLRMCGNPADAQEAAQEAFLSAWQSLPFFRGEASFSTWLYRLASNLCIDFLRNTRRKPAVPLTFEDPEGEEQRIEVVDPAPQPEEALLASEQQAQLDAAMQELEPEHRRILTLRVVNDLSYTDIAEILGIKEGTVKSRLARAREKLRKNYYK